MTREEAIKMIQTRIDTDFMNDEPFPEDLNLAIEALEKAIPMKPIYRNEYMHNYGECPRCHGESLKHNGLLGLVFSGHGFCDGCGQAIDWSEETE